MEVGCVRGVCSVLLQSTTAELLACHTSQIHWLGAWVGGGSLGNRHLLGVVNCVSGTWQIYRIEETHFIDGIVLVVWTCLILCQLYSHLAVNSGGNEVWVCGQCSGFYKYSIIYTPHTTQSQRRISSMYQFQELVNICVFVFCTVGISLIYWAAQCTYSESEPHALWRFLLCLEYFIFLCIVRVLYIWLPVVRLLVTLRISGLAGLLEHKAVCSSHFKAPQPCVG